VLVLDKTLNPMLNTPTTFANASIGGLASLLQQARTTPGVSTVFVQSIGTPTPQAGSADAWNQAAAELENLGGNTDVFLSLGDGGGSRPAGATGWYSFVAAPDNGCLPSSPTPCGSASEASAPLTHKSGDLSGALGRNQTWQYAPLIDEVGDDEHTGELLTLAYRPPQTWPFSDDADARAILNWLSRYDSGGTDLTDLGNGECYDPGNVRDVRSSYCSMEINWATRKAELGDSQTRTGVCATTEHPFDRDKYAQVCDQISREIAQLSDVKDDMVTMKNQIGSQQALTAYLAVQQLADEVKRSVEAGGATADRNVFAEGLEIAAESVELVSLLLPPPTQEAGELFGATLSLTGEITSLVEGDEQGESAVGEPVTVAPADLGFEMQQRVNAAGAAFNHAWDMLVSDPAKLNAAHQNFVVDPNNPVHQDECKQTGVTCGIWRGVPDDLDNKQPLMQNAVRHWAAGKLMAATYDVWLLPTNQGSKFVPGCGLDKNCRRDVTPADVPGIVCVINPNSTFNSRDWNPFGGVSPDAAYYLRDRLGLTLFNEGLLPRRGNSIWLLAQSPNVFDPNARSYYPPQSLLTNLYAPPGTTKTGGGYGWERPWLYSRGQRFQFHSATLPNSDLMECNW
jgi:hypothetical protein